MSRSTENKDQISFFGNEQKNSETNLTGFVNDEHYDSAEKPIEEDYQPHRVKKAASSPKQHTNDEIEQITLDAEIAPEHTVRPQKVTVSKEIIPEIEPAKPKSTFWQFNVNNSLILTFIVFVADYIGRMFRNSLFAKIFTSFSNAASRFTETFIYNKFSSPASLKIRNATKKTVRRSATKAGLPMVFSKFFTSLTKIKIRVYGLGFLSFGITAMVVHFFIHRFFEKFTANAFTPITASLVIIASFFLISTGKTLADSVKESFILSVLIFNFLGINKPQFNEIDEIYFSPSGACIIGVLFGALTLFLPAHFLLAILLILVYTYIIIKFPETGVISLIMIMPFANITVILYTTTIITLAYIFKILTGKRTPNFEFPDIFLAIFTFLTFISEICSFGSKSPTFTSSVFIFIYFLCICTLCEKTWFERAVNALIFETFIFSGYSIFVSFIANQLGVTIDRPANTDIGLSDATVFGSTSVLSVILTCGIFYMLASFFTTKSKSNKFAYILLICVSLIFMFRESSPLIILALLIGLILFFILVSSKTFIAVVAAAVILPLLPLFNSGVYSGISTVIEGEFYRLNIWHAVINMLYSHGLTGIGVAPDAFSSIYATYYVGNTVSIPHAHSLILQIFISLGILGLILFAIVIFFLLQGSFSFGRNCVDKSSRSRLLCYAGMCSVITMVIAGFGEYIGYNPRVMMLFWLICGLTVCARRTSNELSDIDKLMLEINTTYNG